MTQSIKKLQVQIQKLKSKISELEVSNAQLNLVIEHTGVGIWDWYVQTGDTIFNERWANIIGYTLEELSPVSIETWMKYAHPDDLEESDRILKEHWKGGSKYYIFESRMKHKNGQWIWVSDTGQVIEWESEGVPKRMIGTHLEITEQKETQFLLAEANSKLEELIRIDPLTKISNRRAYDERLTTELATAKRFKRPLSLLMIDIDNFKQYNDIYGHENGDIALMRVAKQLEKSLPREIDFVARYGGEEFVIILPQTSIQGAELICKALLKNIMALAIEHQYSKFSKILTISIGISSTEVGYSDLLVHADNALYKAKENGRNQYQIYANK